MKQILVSVFFALIVGAVATFFAFPTLVIIGAVALTYFGFNLMTSPVQSSTLESPSSAKTAFSTFDLGPVKKRIQSIKSSLKLLPPLLVPPVQEITETAEEILEEVKKRPENTASGRRYISHYLESTETIINRYLHVKNNTQREMAPLEQKMEFLLTKVSKSFRSQRENLLEDDMLHLTTEMEVLEKTLELES